MAKPALLVIDMNNDFVTGVLKTERAQKIIPNIKRLVEAAHRAGVPVIYVGDAHLPQDPEIPIWGEHSMKGTKGAEVIPELKPAKEDFVLEKRAYSAFHETGLDMLLRSLGVDTVILTGLHTNICVRHTAADAFFKGYKIVVPNDCVEALTEEEHREGLKYLERIYAAKTASSQEIIEKELKPPTQK